MQIRKYLLLVSVLLLTAASAFADDVKGSKPEAGKTYNLYNVSKGQYLLWDEATKQFSWGTGRGTPVSVSLVDGETGSYSLTIGGNEMATSFQGSLTVGNASSPNRQWLLTLVDKNVYPSDESYIYALGCRDNEATAASYIYWSTLTDNMAGSYAEPQMNGHWKFVTEDDLVRTYVLDENSGSYVRPNAEYVAVNVHLIYTPAANGIWNTLCLPFSLTRSEIDALWGRGTEVVEYITCEDRWLHFVTVDNIEAGKPYLLKLGADYKKPEDGKFLVKRIQPSVFVDSPQYVKPTGGDVTFYASFTKTEAPAGAYVLNNNDVYHLQTKQGMRGFRGYFLTDDPTGAPITSWRIDRDVTDINTIIRQRGRVDIYNLKGQLLRQGATSAQGLDRGIYMIDNQKVFVR